MSTAVEVVVVVIVVSSLLTIVVFIFLCWQMASGYGANLHERVEHGQKLRTGFTARSPGGFGPWDGLSSIWVVVKSSRS